MTSKYDEYWEYRLGTIKKLLEEAFNKGSSHDLNVSDLQDHGDREDWYGAVEVSGEGLKRKETGAHARSLGKVLLKHDTLNAFGDSMFRLTISRSLKLNVKLVTKPEKGKKVVPPSLPAQPHNPLLTTAIYSLMNALEFFQRGEERQRQGAMIFMDQAVEYTLKAKLYQIDHIKFMETQLEQLDYIGAIRELEKSEVTILKEEKVELRKVHGVRNYAQHRAVIPDSIWTREYMRWVYKFIRRFVLENFGISIESQIPSNLRTGLQSD